MFSIYEMITNILIQLPLPDPRPPPSLPLNSFGVDAQDLQLMPAFNQFIRGVIQAINKPMYASHMK